MVKAQQQIEKRERITRKKRWEFQDEGILIQKQHRSKRKGSKLLEQLSGKAKLNMSTEYIMKLTRS